MPLTDYACPNCDGLLHSDDLIERECITPNCGCDLMEYETESGWELPKWEP